MKHNDVGQNRGAIKKEAEARTAAIASMKRKTGAHGNDGGASKGGYGHAPLDKKGMSCGSRGGETDHAGDGSRSWAEKKGRADDGALPDHCQRATDVGLSTHPVAVNTMGSSHRPEEQPATRFLFGASGQ